MREIYQKAFTPEILLEMGEQSFLKIIRSIGLAPTKSRYVLQLTKIIMETYHGKIPETRADLESLPGVGRKTASVILGEIFHQPTIAVDTHVFRVTKRLGWHDESTPAKAERVLLGKIPLSYLPNAHHLLIYHGRLRCSAHKPKCCDCLLSHSCPSVQKDQNV